VANWPALDAPAAVHAGLRTGFLDSTVGGDPPLPIENFKDRHLAGGGVDGQPSGTGADTGESS
jgi:hypothetical protein